MRSQSRTQNVAEGAARVRITVLGKSPAWQDADGACSGYLVEEHGARCCSTAATACSPSCARSVDYIDVDAVVISHLHADHFLDLVPFSYALTYAPRQQPVPVDRWPGPTRRLHAPPGARESCRRVVGAWGNEDLSRTRFALREYDPADDAATSGRSRCASTTCRTSCRPTPSTSRPPTAAAASPTAPTRAPRDELCEFAAAPTC